jgi:hypothetical protein
MANEITLQIGLNCTNGEFTFPRIGSSNQINQTTIGGGGPGVITAVTTGDGTTVNLSGMTNPGWAYFKNLDTTNFVLIGTAGTTGVGYLARLDAGEECAIRLNPAMTSDILYIKADTASVKVDVRVLEK